MNASTFDLEQHSAMTHRSVMSKHAMDKLKSTCSHSFFETDRLAVSGYTGKRFPKKEQDSASPVKMPALGYTGWYTGKTEGKIGRIDLHRSNLSSPEPVKVSSPLPVQSSDQSNDAFGYSLNRVLNYENAIQESATRGQSIEKIIRDIKQKLEFRFQTKAERRSRVKTTFAIYDVDNNGMCSEDSFSSCLTQLSVVLTRAEFGALCSQFDEFSTGQIAYLKFLDIVCPI